MTGYQMASAKLAASLQAVRDWLGIHNTAIMTALLLIPGVSPIGKGPGASTYSDPSLCQLGGVADGRLRIY